MVPLTPRSRTRVLASTFCRPKPDLIKANEGPGHVELLDLLSWQLGEVAVGLGKEEDENSKKTRKKGVLTERGVKIDLAYRLGQ